MTHRAGYNLHYNDPTFYESTSRNAPDITANVAAHLILDLRDPARPVPGIMYFATRAVAKHEELLQDYGGSTCVGGAV
jgi:hypothetical protein